MHEHGFDAARRCDSNAEKTLPRSAATGYIAAGPTDQLWRYQGWISLKNPCAAPLPAL